MSSNVLLKASGLQTSPNELSREEGALIEANNIIIKREGIIEQRRGFKLYGTELPDITERVKQLTTYRSRIIRHYFNKLQYDSDGSGTFESFAGTFTEPQEGLRMKFIEANGNFYFTTADGVKKISARTANDFTTADDYIISAGAVKAVDLSTRTIYTPNSQSAFLPQDGAISYRVVWGYKDINSNLILGTPSQRVVASNPMIELLIRDYMRLLAVLDGFENSPLTAARINDKNYVEQLGLTLLGSSSDLYVNLVALTSKLDNDIFLADQGAVAPLQIGSASVASNILTITFSTGDPSLYTTAGSKIQLAGGWKDSAAADIAGNYDVVTVNTTQMTLAVTAANGAAVLTSPTIYSNEYRSITQPDEPSIPTTNDELVALQVYIEDITARLASEPVDIISVADQTAVADLDVTTTSTVELDITIPDGVDSNYFFQVYRSSVAQALGAATFDDVVPSDELQLVYEAYPTAAELTAKEIVIEDITPDAFRGANLYTNASTGEGILQANDIPPFAKDINRYKNSVFYANTRTPQRMNLNLLGVTGMIADYDNAIIPTLTITGDDSLNIYRFITGQQEITDVVCVADVADSLNGKYFLLDTPTKNFYVWLETTTATDPAIADRTGIKVELTTNDSAPTVALKVGNKLSTYLDYFLIGITTATIEVTNLEVGECPDAVDGNTGFTITNVQQGRGERIQPQITKVTCIPAVDFVSAGPADHFLIYDTYNKNRYCVWFDYVNATDPTPAGWTSLGIEVESGDTAGVVAGKLQIGLPDVFQASTVSNEVTITNVQYGTVLSPTENVTDPDFTIEVTQVGALDVLLSPEPSPARAVDQTARSLVRVINKNPSETIYGYYLSSAFDVPGKMLLEARSLADENPFYVVGNNASTGISFNPAISPEGTITTITAANPSVITTSSPHGMTTGQQVVINGSNSIGIVDGLHTVTVLSNVSFSVPVNVLTAGSSGSFTKATAANFSENEEKANRVYYSKFLQPDAVPISNFFDVGATDKQILRIFPLRDSLFVFKEDGLYRISGESAPFSLELFDNSFILLAPDSVDVSNNIIYAWTTQGIQSLSEGGATIISRPIDDIILRTQSANYVNFKTVTWGVGYESDNSYTVFAPYNEADDVAGIGYRYSTLTNTWTTYDLSPTCGVINSADDKLYMGASDVAYIEQERKTFSRLDYADRELDNTIGVNKLFDERILLPSVTGVSVGDVLVQDQTVTTYEFNTLLKKLDFDSGVNDTDYYSTLALSAGMNPRAQLVLLAAKLDDDSGVTGTNYESTIESKNGVITNISETNPTIITSNNHGLFTGRVVLIDSSDSIPSINGTHTVTVLDANRFTIDVSVLTSGHSGNWQTVDSNFDDLKYCYNKVVELLNADILVAFTNYRPIDNNTLQEAIITSVNQANRQIEVNLELDFLVGAITIYKAIPSSFTYSPMTMGDPLSMKHMREATLMFETRTLTGGTMSFATDLLPEFQDVPFNLDGNGIFGHNTFGEGFFGGRSNSAPFRTYIPRQCQRCRYMVVRFAHTTAREDYRVNGISLTGNTGLSTRAYR